jgi:hypothetical protein
MIARISIAALLLFSGCAPWNHQKTWNAEKWDLTRYRDPRAADIDRRLTEHPEPSGAAFQQQSE